LYYDKYIVNAYFNQIPNNFIGIVKDYFHHSLIDSIAWTSAVAIPKSIFSTRGNFDVTLKSGQDTDLWIRIALKEQVAFSKDITARRHITESLNHLSQSDKRVDRVKITEHFKHEEKHHQSLKKYIDFNRVNIAIERK